jgi:hypothetical protein
MIGVAVFCTYVTWVSIADLGVPSNAFGPSVDLPTPVNVVFAAACILMLLTMILMPLEFIWQTWRGRRGARAAQTERR